jgi:RNA polymerase sigma-70 factor (ECF subfamily)
MLSRKTQDRRIQFEELFMSNYQAFFRMGIRLCGNREFTKDVIQSFFVELWEKEIWEKEIEYMPAYLQKAFYRKMCYEIKRQQKRPDANSGDPLELPTPSYETLLIQQQQAETLHKSISQAMQQLPEQQRQMLHMRFRKGMDYDEIASQTGKSRQTIYNQIHSAVKKMRKNLSGG